MAGSATPITNSATKRKNSQTTHIVPLRLLAATLHDTTRWRNVSR